MTHHLRRNPCIPYTPPIHLRCTISFKSAMDNSSSSQMGSEIAKTDGKKRGKYGRPCDMCASRRVRCVFRDDSPRCVGCQAHGAECTNKRVRKKLGPKSIRRKHEGDEMPFLQRLFSAENPKETDGLTSSDSQQFSHDLMDQPRPGDDLFNCFEHSPNKGTANIPVDMLLPYLQVYQTWFYGYWPVLSVADLMLTMACNSTMDNQVQYIELNESNAMSYALACAVCAAIATQISFVSQSDKVISIQSGLPPQVYADEAKRVRNLFDYSSNPNVVTLISSFFLYAHYVNHKGKAQQAIVYLREAISMCQILGFHEPTAYVNKSAAEIHRWKKIYYMLLVTERFMCFEDGMPVILESCIELPLLENEEYPSLLAGFTELVKVFSIPDKNFFGEINHKSGHMKVDLFRDYLQSHGINDKKKWIQKVQLKLVKPLNPHIKISDSQTLNIILSQSWIQAIAWHITSENGLIKYMDDETDCFSVNFPLKIARDFLAATSGLPSFAFESNGPGICVKLLEIANSLTFAIQKSSKQYLMADSLETIFGLVNQFKNDVTLPLDVYNKVGTLIASFKNFVPRNLRMPDLYQHHATVEELFDDDEEGSSTHIENSVPQISQVNDVNNNNSSRVVGQVEAEPEQFFDVGQGNFGLSPNGSITDLVAAISPTNFGTSQQRYVQAWNNMNILGKLSPVGSGATLASIFMQNSTSFRHDKSRMTSSEGQDDQKGTTFTFV